MKKTGMLLLFIVVVNSLIYGQKKTWKDTTKLVIPELKYNLNKSGSHYLKATVVGQIWLRNTDMNPGSTIDNVLVTNYTDIGIRRLRISAWGQITDRLYFYTQFGQNNFNFLSKRYIGAFFHDAVTEFKFVPQLQIGGGLTGWSGLSRYSSPAVGSLLTLDAPLYQQVTNGINDQFLRKLSVYAKGQIGRLDYRIAASSPMTVTNSATPIPAISHDASFSLNPPKWQTQGYLMWQFFEKENNVNPYTTGTYLGNKKVLNVGAGWIHQKDAMWSLNQQNDTVSHDLLLLNADVFLDLPLSEKGNAITAYVAGSTYQMGPNYYRDIAVMNPANGTKNGSLNGSGNGVPMIGSGTTLYGQIGYKFKNGLMNEAGTIQPYAAFQYSDLKKLKDPVIIWNVGVNYLIHNNHTGKLSLDYQSRPVFEADALGDYVQTKRKGMLVLQYQISL